MFSLRTIALSLLAVASAAMAERHTITIHNRCGYGTPHIIRGGNVVSTASSYTAYEAMPASLVFLQTGRCDDRNGSGCMTVELTLKNPDSGAPGSGSSVDLSMVPPLAFSVPTSFKYYSGCDGLGASCNNHSCPDVFRVFNDYHALRNCQANDVNLEVTFC